MILWFYEKKSEIKDFVFKDVAANLKSAAFILGY